MKYILITLVLTACTEADMQRSAKSLQKAQDSEMFIWDSIEVRDTIKAYKKE